LALVQENPRCNCGDQDGSAENNYATGNSHALPLIQIDPVGRELYMRPDQLDFAITLQHQPRRAAAQVDLILHMHVTSTGSVAQIA
jgi:hypothetical protein